MLAVGRSGAVELATTTVVIGASVTGVVATGVVVGAAVGAAVGAGAGAEPPDPDDPQALMPTVASPTVIAKVASTLCPPIVLVRPHQTFTP